MPRGLVGKGDFRRGNPVNWTPDPAHFGNQVTWAQNPAEFGNPVNEPKDFGNPVTLPKSYGNQIGGTAAVPTFSPAAGAYGVPQFIEIISAGADAIYYTLDGTAPSAATSRLYEGNVFISSSKTLKAIAVIDGTPSSAGTAAYVIG